MAELRPVPHPDQPPEASRVERRFGALAHGSALVVGLPLLVVVPYLQFLAFVPCPVVAYFIGKYFRSNQQVWGAFQCMQASVMQLILLISVFSFQLVVSSLPGVANLLFMVCVLVFIYTLWGAWDSLFGMNFRYLLIGPYIERVSHINLSRPQRRRSWFGRRREEPSQDNPEQNRRD